jgi:ribosomal protein S18 acetylase RimI-like enzyme
MSFNSKEMRFCIEKAAESDWPWIVQGQAEIVWRRLGLDQQREVSRQTVEQRAAQRVEEIRGDKGFPTEAFVAKTEDGTQAGYVWVARTHHDFTGQLEASLLSQYVAEAYRNQGLGRRLMETAEEWARQQGLPRISLSVGTHNQLAQNLYKTLGYQVDILRMTKELGEQEAELLLSDY